MHVVLLAGGEGRRLFPHTESLPKPLVPIDGEPVVAILLKLLAKAGAESVDMAVNHRAEQIKDALGDGSKFGLRLRYCHEPEPLSTIGPLTLIDNLPDQFLVMNADVLTDLPIRLMYEAHCKSPAELTVACTNRRDQTDFGVLTLDDKKQLVGFAEKPISQLTVSMGIYAINRSLLERLASGVRFGFDDLMHLMLQEKRVVMGYHWNGYWLDIGRPDDYEQAKRDSGLYRQWLSDKS